MCPTMKTPGCETARRLAAAWPDPAKVGVPANPERSGWHWIVPRDPKGAWPVFWSHFAGWQWASSSTDEDEPGEYNANLAAGVWAYGGPCLASDARLAAAEERVKVLEAALREIVSSAEDKTTPYACLTEEQASFYDGLDFGKESAAEIARAALQEAPRDAS